MTSHGGKRAGAGRPAGAQNRATKAAKATLTELAQSHSEAALWALVEIMQDKDATAPARIAAANAVLDRGYGRPRQSTELSGLGGEPVTEIQRVIVDPPLDVSRLSTDTLRELVEVMDHQRE